MTLPPDAGKTGGRMDGDREWSRHETEMGERSRVRKEGVAGVWMTWAAGVNGMIKERKDTGGSAFARRDPHPTLPQSQRWLPK